MTTSSTNIIDSSKLLDRPQQLRTIESETGIKCATHHRNVTLVTEAFRSESTLTGQFDTDVNQSISLQVEPDGDAPFTVWVVDNKDIDALARILANGLCGTVKVIGHSLGTPGKDFILGTYGDHFSENFKIDPSSIEGITEAQQAEVDWTMTKYTKDSIVKILSECDRYEEHDEDGCVDLYWSNEWDQLIATGGIEYDQYDVHITGYDASLSGDDAKECCKLGRLVVDN